MQSSLVLESVIIISKAFEAFCRWQYTI